MDEFIGTIKLFAGSYAPKNWMFCDGSLIRIQNNSALFSILGTTYGGNGIDTFAIPNLKGRMALGAGNVNANEYYPLGVVAGNTQTTLLAANLPSAPIQLKVANTNANVTTPTSNSSIAITGKPNGRDFDPIPGFAEADPDTAINSKSVSLNGQNIPINNMPPYVGLNYIICVYGVYPPRD